MFKLLFLACFFSLTSMAMTMKFSAPDYQVEATFTPVSMQGTVFGSVIANIKGLQAPCNGQFNLDLAKSSLMIEFKTPLGCSNENVAIDITQEQYGALQAGKTVEVVFRSKRFSKASKKALVSMMA